MLKTVKFIILSGAILLPLNAFADETSRYGYEKKLQAQEDYLKDLGDDFYATHKDSWEEKLKTRKQEFNVTLKREYLDIAKKLEADKNYTDATYFRRKGLDAERADFDVLPEDPYKWNVKSDIDLDQLRVARLDLIDSLVGYTPAVMPEESAKSIAYYDCWVQQSLGRSTTNKDNCRELFKTNYSKIAKLSKEVQDKNIAEVSEKYKWVEIEKPVYEKLKKPVEKVAEKKTAGKDGNELYTVEYQSPPVSSLKDKKNGKAKTTKATAEAEKIKEVTKGKSDKKTSTAYNPAEDKKAAAKTKDAKDKTAKAGDKTKAGSKEEVAKADVTKPTPPTQPEKPKPPVAQVYGPLPASEAGSRPDKTLISDQSDNKSADLVYVVYFDGKSNELTDKGKAELDKALEEIKKNSPKNISVNGHTDRSFDNGSSLITSKKRADAARDYLISKGIEKGKIRTYGFGKTDNLVENAEGEEKPANNRAEIVFKGMAN